MLKLTKSINTSILSKGNTVGLLSFPVLVLGIYALITYGFPRLPSAAQNAIENGMPGMFLGILGGALLLSTAAASWQSAKDIRSKTHQK